MLKRREIKEIADKLKQDTKGTEKGLKKLFEQKSILVKDWREFFRICVDAPNPEVRTQNVIHYLVKENLKTDIAEIVQSLVLNQEHCFGWLAVFNLRDDTSPVASVSYGELHNKLISQLFSYKEKQEGLDRHSLLIEIVSKIGFLAFGIRFLAWQAIDYSYNPIFEKKAKELIKALGDPFLDRKEITKNRHWAYFVLAEKLRKRYGLRGAFRKIAKLVSSTPGTINTIYFTMKNEAKKENLTPDKIINKYHLGRVITKYLKEDAEGQPISPK